MNELVKQVTPLTRAIIWLARDERDVTNSNYRDLDYLLDGLLTANVNASQQLSSRVIVGKSFDKSLFVMIVSEIKSAEIQSFVTLIKQDLGPEQDIIVIDEAKGYEKLKTELKSVSSHIRVLS